MDGGWGGAHTIQRQCESIVYFEGTQSVSSTSKGLDPVRDWIQVSSTALRSYLGGLMSFKGGRVSGSENLEIVPVCMRRRMRSLKCLCECAGRPV